MKVLVGGFDKLLSVIEGMGHEIKGHWCGDAQISFPSQMCVEFNALFLHSRG